MSNNVAVRGNTAVAIPADIAALFGSVESNIVAAEQIPHLSIGGKVWKVVVEGNEKVITAAVDGEQMPAPTVRVIMLNQVPKRSRAYFMGQYTEGSNKAPDCWSINGETPDSEVKAPQHSRCDSCPQSIKGSKINAEGDPTVACAQNKRLVVVPSNKPDFTALLLKLPVTSLWEAEPKEEDKNWYAYDAYLKYLKANGVTHTAMVETIMKFDSSVKYPKVLFKFAGYVTADTAKVVVNRMTADDVMKTLGIKPTVDGAKTKTAPAAPAAQESADEAVDNSAAELAEAQRKAESDAKVKKAEAAKRKVEKAEEARVAAEAAERKAKAALVADDDGFGAPPAETKVAAKVETSSKVAVAEDSQDLDKLLSAWE